MRAFIIVAVSFWLLCGLAGTWMLGFDNLNGRAIAKGPITLAEAFSKAPEQTRVPQ